MSPDATPAVTLDTPARQAAEAGQWLAVVCPCGRRASLGPWTYGAARCSLRELPHLLRCRGACGGAKGRAQVWPVER